MNAKIISTLLLSAGLASAGPTYTIANTATNVGTPSCTTGPQLASNGNVMCGSLLYTASTGITSTISTLAGVASITGAVTNASGEVAGSIYNSGVYSAYAIVGSTATALPIPTGTIDPEVTGIDNAGDIVGTVFTSGVGYQGIVWKPNLSYVNLGPVKNAAAIVISPNGTVDYDSQASNNLLYSISGGTSTALAYTTPLLPTGVSNTGLVIGSTLASGYWTPILTTTSSTTEPCTSATSCSGASFASGFRVQGSPNSAGSFVGYDASTNEPFVYSSGSFQDLGALLNSSLNAILGGTGWALTSAWGINDNGQIVASASNGTTTDYLLLTPVTTSGTPEPGTLAMLGIGAVCLYLKKRLTRSTASLN